MGGDYLLDGGKELVQPILLLMATDWLVGVKYQPGMGGDYL